MVFEGGQDRRRLNLGLVTRGASRAQASDRRSVGQGVDLPAFPGHPAPRAAREIALTSKRLCEIT